MSLSSVRPPPRSNPDKVLIKISEHVEIYPIELKLDYKPKRVDFAALREGKTMELMNFFHFDGAEMTLRHITLSGVRSHLPLFTVPLQEGDTDEA